MPEKAPRSSAKNKAGWLDQMGGVTLARPRLVVVVASLLLVVCGLIAWSIPVSTSRYKLVSADHPFQARLLSFFERFGHPDSLVMVVSGGDEQARRNVVDQLTERCEQEPELKGRVLGRIQLEQVAELLLLIKPEGLKELRDRVESEPADLIEGGLPAWIGLLEEQISAGLEDGEEEAPDEETADQGLRDLGKVLQALTALLEDEKTRTELPPFGNETNSPKGVSVDKLGYVVSADGDTHLVAFFPELPGAEGYQVKPMVDKIRAIRDQIDTSGVTANLTGLPALVADELTIVKRGLWQSSGATTVGILLLLMLAFRSFRYTVLTLLPLATGMVLTLAVARGLFGGLNLVTSTFVSVLLALGIDFGVYVLSRYGELVRNGAEPTAAIRGALAKAGPGMLMGAATTVMAFLMTTTTEFTAYSELGYITAIGLVLMLAVTFLVLPALIFLAGRGKPLKSPELPGISHLPALVRSGRIALPVGAVVLIALGATTFDRIGFNMRYFDFLPEETESALGLKHIQSDKSLSPIQAGAGADSVKEARQLADKLRALPTVGAVQTATDALPELTEQGLTKLRAGFAGLQREPDFDKLRQRKRPQTELVSKVQDLADVLDEVGFTLRQAGRKTAALDEAKKAVAALAQRAAKLPDDSPALTSLERRIADVLQRAWTTAKAVADRGHYLPSDLPSVFEARFVSKDGKALAVYANPAGDIWDTETARQFSAEVESVEPEIAGMAVNIHHHQRMIREGFTRAAALSAGFVLVILLVGFRRLSDALLAMLPVVVCFGWLIGLMGVLHLDFNVANVVVPALILGIGIDAGAHMTHRWRQSADQNGGVANLDEMLRGTGAAVLMASLTTATGFAALMLADYGGMKSVGLMMTLGVCACMLAALLVLPALLVLLKRAQ